MPELREDAHTARVPPQALLLSLLSLWVPVASSSLFPEWTNADVGVLIWLLALVPPFLLSYYRGWMGASLALAGGMAAFAVAQIVVIVLGASIPPTEIMLGLIVVLIMVSLGSGVLASVFHRSLGAAEQMALTDPGTGLPNRRHGMLHLQRAFAAAGRGNDLSVVMFDLDKFKAVNDRFGHHTGDEVLRVFGEILLRHTRAMHLSARFGGEEFVAILDGIDADGATVMAGRVLESLRTHDFAWGRLTVSAGISEYEDGMASPDVLIAAADQALYRAKGRGGDRVVVLARQGSGDSGVVPMADSDESREGNGELVLIVDDDPAVLRTLSRGLLRRRYQPIEASDPFRALQIVRGLGEPLDLVITDLVMPEMSGFRLVEMLLEIQPDLRALYISGYSSDEVRWSGVPGQLKSFLPKPIGLDTLTSSVAAILAAEPPASRNRPATGSVAGEAPHATTSADGRGADGRPNSGDRLAMNGRSAAMNGRSAAMNGRSAAIGGQTAAVGRSGPGTQSMEDRLEASTALLDEAYGELLARLAWAAEYRDDVTGQHAERVARLCGLIALRLGRPGDEAGRIEQASLLHDLGKIGVPDSILHKPDILTPTEREIMQQHTMVGGDLLAGSRHPLLQEAERVARSHHERWDGAGYPQGLAGEAIPVSARITAVADAFDSLTQARPYRPAIGTEEALARIMEDRGTHFDPDVVDALLELHFDGRLETADKSVTAGEWKGARPAAAAAE